MEFSKVFVGNERRGRILILGFLSLKFPDEFVIERFLVPNRLLRSVLTYFLRFLFVADSQILDYKTRRNCILSFHACLRRILSHGQKAKGKSNRPLGLVPAFTSSNDVHTCNHRQSPFRVPIHYERSSRLSVLVWTNVEVRQFHTCGIVRIVDKLM